MKGGDLDDRPDVLASRDGFILTEKPYRSLIPPDQAEHAAHSRGFSGTVGPEESVDVTRADGKVEVGYGDVAAIGAPEAANFECGALSPRR